MSAVRKCRQHNCQWPGCNKSFNRSDHLARHQLNHTSPGLICQRCRARFQRQDLLDRHLVRHKQKDKEAGGEGLGLVRTRKPSVVDGYRRWGILDSPSSSSNQSGDDAAPSPFSSADEDSITVASSQANLLGVTTPDLFSDEFLDASHRYAHWLSPDLLSAHTFMADDHSMVELDTDAMFNLTPETLPDGSNWPGPLAMMSNSTDASLALEIPGLGEAERSQGVSIPIQPTSIPREDVRQGVTEFVQSLMHTSSTKSSMDLLHSFDPWLSLLSLQEASANFFRIHNNSIHEPTFNPAKTSAQINLLLHSIGSQTPLTNPAKSVYEILKSNLLQSLSQAPSPTLEMIQSVHLVCKQNQRLPGRETSGSSLWEDILAGMLRHFDPVTLSSASTRSGANLQDQWTTAMKLEEHKRVAHAHFATNVRQRMLSTIPQRPFYDLHEFELPCPQEEWKAPTAEAWESCRQTGPKRHLHEVLQGYLKRQPGDVAEPLNLESFQMVLHGLLSIAADMRAGCHWLGWIDDLASCASVQNWRAQITLAVDMCMADFDGFSAQEPWTSEGARDIEARILYHFARVVLDQDDQQSQLRTNGSLAGTEQEQTNSQASIWHAAHILKDCLAYRINPGTMKVPECLHDALRLAVTVFRQQAGTSGSKKKTVDAAEQQELVLHTIHICSMIINRGSGAVYDLVRHLDIDGLHDLVETGKNIEVKMC